MHEHAAKRRKATDEVEKSLLEQRAAASEGLAALASGNSSSLLNRTSLLPSERNGTVLNASLAGHDHAALRNALERQRLLNQLEAEAAMRRIQKLKEEEIELQLLQRRRDTLIRLELQEKLAQAHGISLLGADQLLRPREVQGSPVSDAASSRTSETSQLETSINSSLKKRSIDESLNNDTTTAGEQQQQKEEQRQEEETLEGSEKHLSPFQAEQWDEHFKQLLAYRKETGHCNVPQHTHINKTLSRWVKRQRYQYKLRLEGKPSNMTRERMKALEDVGFVWDSHSAVWEERFGELQEFHRQYNHCNVPTTYKENPKLAAWVKCQRRQYKIKKTGKVSNLNKERLEKLEALGFEWQLRSYHNVNKKNKSKKESPPSEELQAKDD